MYRDTGQHNFDGLVQERQNSIANALELSLYCTNLSTYNHIIYLTWNKTYLHIIPKLISSKPDDGFGNGVFCPLSGPSQVITGRSTGAIHLL